MEVFITIDVLLSDSEINLLKETIDGRTSINFDDRYIPLMVKGLIIEDFAFNTHLTYSLTTVGKEILNKLNTIN